jgi:cyclopropane fatty-acyl-phospholipid synthase-like methyltransferase
MSQYPIAEHPATLGPISGYAWETDPRHLAFTLARYKFVAKMLNGSERVAEIGCGDGFASRIVQQTVGSLMLYDAEASFLRDLSSRGDARWPVQAREHDILSGPLPETYSGIYCLDVLEHVDHKYESVFMTNLCASLSDHGVLIVGTPSLESQVYAAPHNKVGHINCKSGENLRGILSNWFNNVFMFSQNDEVVHCGFFPMSHYLWGICVGKK